MFEIVGSEPTDPADLLDPYVRAHRVHARRSGSRPPASSPSCEHRPLGPRRRHPASRSPPPSSSVLIHRDSRIALVVTRRGRHVGLTGRRRRPRPSPSAAVLLRLGVSSRHAPVSSPDVIADRLVSGKRRHARTRSSSGLSRAASVRAYSAEDVHPPDGTDPRRGHRVPSMRTRIWLRVGTGAPAWSRRVAPARRAPDAEAPAAIPTRKRDEAPTSGEDACREVRHQRRPARRGHPSRCRPTTRWIRSRSSWRISRRRPVSCCGTSRLIEDLRASRQRLVTAQDEERRKLERNLHDGAQQQLVALAVKLRLAEPRRHATRTKSARAGRRTRTRTATPWRTLRDLARGIYPPLLADQGLAAALEAQARKASLPVRVEPDGVGRYPTETSRRPCTSARSRR